MTHQKQIFYTATTMFGLKVLMFLLKSNLHAKMKAFLFDLSRQELYQKLESEKLLITKDNRRSYEYRKGQFRQSVICLPRNNINRYFADDKEDIKL